MCIRDRRERERERERERIYRNMTHTYTATQQGYRDTILSTPVPGMSESATDCLVAGRVRRAEEVRGKTPNP